MKKLINWKLFSVLLVASVVGIIAIIPYSLALQSVTLSEIDMPIPLWVLIPIQVLQNTALFAVLIFLGLYTARRTGLGLPILEAVLQGETVRGRITAFLLPSFLIGIIGSSAVILLDLLVFNPLMVSELGDKAALFQQSTFSPAAWKGFLASLYGGINEEILLRLGLMSILVWLGQFVSGKSTDRPSLVLLWSANFLSAVLFGIGHLPATAAIFPITPLIVVRAISLNGLIGIGFGYLYFKYGLEAAILAHFTADIVLHVLLVL